MFTVYHSNQVDILKSLLVELIRLNPLENPFAAEQILVQSPGMSQWLKMELANEFGVAANIEFPLPATFIWQMFTEVLPDVPKRSAFNKEAMGWKLMQVLPSLLPLAEFTPLKRYLADDQDGAKLYQLAEKIADIFDGYLVYRPEWIAKWESGQVVSELGDEHPWQPILWQALYDYTLGLGQSPYHRANLYEEFIAALDGGTLRSEHLPKRLCVFGISSLPPRYMDALKALGEHIDVHLMFTNPCRYYWGEVRDRKYLAHLAAKQRQHLVWRQDHSEAAGQSEQLKGSVEDNLSDELHTDVVGNSLLASMGKLGRDNLYLLSQLESNEIEAFVEIDSDSLLHHIQADILNLQEHQNDQELLLSKHKPVIQADDRSLTLHACHSPMREVEVLHDQLLAMFDQDASLKPRDIIVMVADINAYSPAIQAVFGNAPGERFIPYSISDRSASQESPILNGFLQLVALPQSRCLASELLELLEVPAVMRRFELDEQEFLLAKHWVEESGIRWGLNEHTAQALDLPANRHNTWQFGIERMLLGYAMAPDAELFDSPHSGQIAPYNEVQGLGAELAGKLAHFIDKIALYHQLFAQTQPVAKWREALLGALADFFALDLEEELAFKSITDTLSQLQEQLTDANYDAPISAPIIRQYLQDKLSGTRVSQRFLAGQVNFCTLMPMRSIPFKVVCLLGMNDGVYPRSMPPESFDLMTGRTRAGDRSRRDDDRYLFLEALLSAQQALYISYVGRSIQDNSVRVPSVLVSELLEYCQQNYALSGDEALSVDESSQRLLAQLTRHHPLTPFSPQAFRAPHASYAKEWLPAANRSGQPSSAFAQPLDDFLQEASFPLELDLVELQRFWRLPVQYFFNRRLKVVFEPPLPVMEDQEPFVLGGLDSYQMRDALLDEFLASGDRSPAAIEAIAARFIAKQRAQGKLPFGAFGEIEFATNQVQTYELLEELSFITQAPLDDVEVALELDLLGAERPIKLVGWLTQHYQAGLVRYRTGSLRAQDRLHGWIDHLCLAASGVAQRTHLLGYSRKDGVEHLIYPPLADSQQARAWLSELIALFLHGMNAPLAYFPKTAQAAMEAQLKAGKWVDDLEQAHKKMAETFNDGYLFAGEGSNSYIQRIWPQWDAPLAEQAYQLATSVLQTPMLCLQGTDEREGK